MKERWFIKDESAPWTFREVTKEEAMESGVYLWDYDEDTNSNYEIDEITSADLADYKASYIY